MDYAEIKNLMRDMENSSLDSIEIALPEGTKVKMRKSPIIYAGLNYDVTENSTSQAVNKEKNIAVSENIENDLKCDVNENLNTDKQKNEENYRTVKSPMVGTFYTKSSPTAEPFVKVGDRVKKGDVLINGANTSALPEVWATTFYEAKKTSNYIDVKNQRTSNKKNVYTISFYDKKFKILRNIKYKNYEIENKTHELKLGDYTFPIKITVSTFYEVKKVENKIDVQKLKEELSSQVLKELEYKIPVSARIIDSKDKYNVGKNMIEYVVTVTTKEDIAKLDILSKSEAESIIKSNEEKKSKEEGEQKPSNPENRPINDIRNEFKEDIKSNTDDEEN